MTAIPLGFRPVDDKPRARDATRSYAANDAVATGEADIPEGFQLMGPGPGKPSPMIPSAADRQRELETIRAGVPANPLENMLTGARYGLEGTGLGSLQLLSHATPDRGKSFHPFGGFSSGVLNPGVMDAAREMFNNRRAEDPAMHTRAGRVGEFSGELAATAPLGVVGLPAKGAPVLSWMASGALGGGSAAATQPVDGKDFWTAKAEQVGLGATLGAGVPAAGRGLLSLAERTFGPNVLAQIANAANKGANAKPFAQEGEDLAARTGVRMTPAQVSGSKVQTSLENMSRQSVFSADRAFEADQRIAGDAVRYMDRIMNNVTKNPASEAAIGTQIQAATRGAVVKIAAKREAQATADYGAVDRALGGRKFVQADNTMAEADAIIREYSAVATPEAERIVRQAEALKAKLRNNGGMTFGEAQRSRTYYGRGSRGAANVFDDVNPDINRRIATRLFKAFDSDMEQSAARLGSNNLGPGIVPHGYFGGKVGQGDQGLVDAIRRANNNYRRYSQLIDATEAHPVARLFGDHVKLDDVLEFDKIPPETVIARLGQMKPSELTMTRHFLEQQAPEAWQQYKRLLIEKAVDSARTLPTSMGANTVPFNASQFVRALGGDKPDRIKQLQAVFGASEMKEIDDAFRVARRLGDHFGKNTSGTGPYLEVKGIVDQIRTLSTKGVASTAGEVLGLRKVANVMANAEGRRALIQLSRVPPGARQAASLVGLISALAAGHSLQRSNNPQRGNQP